MTWPELFKELAKLDTSSVTPFPDRGDALPAGLLKGVQEFNRREYFQAHETLEELWRRERGTARLFYQGIIQVAVGMAHVQRGNYRGAASLLARGIEKLDRSPPRFLGVDVDALAAAARRCRQMLRALGPQGVRSFPWDQAPVIRIGQGE